ncbi:uncharacterized protein LOC134245396 [Saccostrea cucullata]|uniref:uncharacterized protein LOC134245396 n=1 Tax=Saccostrea cuccullata TaxID=36930 RepID=UPI002ED2F9A2
MATPEKRFKADQEEIEGYIHDVSPLKTSKNSNKYFNAVLQEAEGFSDVVCFRADLQPQLVDFEKNKTPVKLQNVSKVISRNKPGSFDVKITGLTNITSPTKKLPFRFDPPLQEKDTIQQIKNKPQYAKTSLLAKVVNLAEEIVIENHSTQKTLRKKDCMLADNTDTIKLTTWEDHTREIELGKTYVFNNVTVRIWDDVKFITTSVNTCITPEKDFGPLPNIENFDLDDKKETCKITSVSCEQKNSCPLCNVSVEINENLPTFKCCKCCMRQKTINVKKTLKCEVCVEGSTKKFAVATSLLKENEHTKLCSTVDDYEDALLQEHIMVELTGNFVSNIVSNITNT